MSGIFVSYRRASSSAIVYRLVDELKERFGDEAIFFDVESIAPGMSFAQAIQQALSKSTIALIAIGPQWVHVTDEGGKRRLENPDDWVRHEVHAALNSRARVIPLLVEGAEVPSQTLLPSNIQELANLQAFTINKSPEYWDFDIKRLEERLRKIDKNLPYNKGGDIPQPPPPPIGHFSKKVIWGCSLSAIFGFYMVALSSSPALQMELESVTDTVYGLVMFFGLAFALNWMGLSDINKGLTKGKTVAISGMALSALLFVAALGLGSTLELPDADQDYYGTDDQQSVDDVQAEDYVEPQYNPPPVPAKEEQLADTQKPPFKPGVEEEDDSDYQSIPNIAGLWSSNINASYQIGNNLNGTVFFYEYNQFQIQVGYGEGQYVNGVFKIQYTNTLMQQMAPLDLEPDGANLMRGTLYNPLNGQVAARFELYRN